MLCPNCQMKLITSERAGIDMDYCPQCHGVWLDCGCLDKIIDRCIDETNDSSRFNIEQSIQYERLAYADRSKLVSVNLYDTTA